MQAMWRQLFPFCSHNKHSTQIQIYVKCIILINSEINAVHISVVCMHDIVILGRNPSRDYRNNIQSSPK